MNPKKCPCTFTEKSAREPTKSAREHANFCIFGTFEEKVLVNSDKCPWTFPNFLAVKHGKCPWKKPQKVPVNASTCPWIFWKSARKRKIVLVNIFEKMRFTGNFDVHGENKKTLILVTTNFNSIIFEAIATDIIVPTTYPRGVGLINSLSCNFFETTWLWSFFLSLNYFGYSKRQRHW